ncbi:MAG TPA: hypothetical protein VIH57_09990 [Bacteroidales bacterium]
MPKTRKKNTGPPNKHNKNSLASRQENDNKTESSLKETVRKPAKKQNDMEAYHPHGHHEGRKLKDYVFEFIMLFIAITGGFFMENMREHMVDRHKEMTYMTRLVRDLKDDSITIRRIIKINQAQMKGLDSLMDLLENPVSTMNPERFYNLTIQYLNNYNGFTPRDMTITQLKNSGGLRLIENNSVSDSIISYYSTIDHFHEINVKLNYSFVDDTYKLELQFLDFSAYARNKKLSVPDTDKLKELKNRCFAFKLQLGWDNVWLKQVNEQGISLLKYVKEEYRVED